MISRKRSSEILSEFRYTCFTTSSCCWGFLCTIHDSPGLGYFLTHSLFTRRAFFERTIMCNSLVWSCSLTGKSNLTYQEAVDSEKKAIKTVSDIPFAVSVVKDLKQVSSHEIYIFIFLVEAAYTLHCLTHMQREGE